MEGSETPSGRDRDDVHGDDVHGDDAHGEKEPALVPADDGPTAEAVPDEEIPPPVDAEDAHEREVQEEAIHHAPQDVQDFLERAYHALLAEGFLSTPMQYKKKGQVFGVVKEHGHELQLHCRAFSNGVLESEVELSNRYIQHLWSPRRSAHEEIRRVLEKHGVETHTINTEFRTRTGADREMLPRFYTRTSDVVKGVAGVAGAVGAVAIARFIQHRGGPTKRRGRRR